MSETKSNQIKGARFPRLLHKTKLDRRHLWKPGFQIISQRQKTDGSKSALEKQALEKQALEYRLFDTVFRILKATSPNTNEPEPPCPTVSSLWLTPDTRRQIVFTGFVIWQMPLCG